MNRTRRFSWIAFYAMLFCSPLRAHAVDQFDFLGVETWDAEPLKAGVKLLSAEIVAEQQSRIGEVLRANASWSVPRLGLGLNLGSFADFYFTCDAYRGLSQTNDNGGTQVLHGGGSPRSWVKFRYLEQSGWAPSLGVALGFKWPAANEPFEVDEGDFLVQWLASKKWSRDEIHFNTGPVIYGDSQRNSSQLHTWNYSLRVTHAFEDVQVRAVSAHRIDAELHLARWLPGSWAAFWNMGTSELNRTRISLTYRYPWEEGRQLWLRATQSLIDAGTQRSVVVGYSYEWGASGTSASLGYLSSY